jgi:hypothetical protein
MRANPSTVPPLALRLTSLKRALLAFWALYLTLVFASNLMDALKALDVLPDVWPFASGNYALVSQVTSIYDFPVVFNALLFAGVLVWQAAAAGLFWRAFRRFRFVEPVGLAAVYAAFTASLGLWMAFILADEFFIAYEVAGLEATHVRLFTAQLASLLVLRLLPEA